MISLVTIDGNIQYESYIMNHIICRISLCSDIAGLLPVPALSGKEKGMGRIYSVPFFAPVVR